MVTCPLAPNTSHLISGYCPSPRDFALGLLQTLPRDNALALSLTFGSANTWYQNFHLLVKCHARHTRLRAAARASARRIGPPFYAILHSLLIRPYISSKINLKSLKTLSSSRFTSVCANEVLCFLLIVKTLESGATLSPFNLYLARMVSSK